MKKIIERAVNEYCSKQTGYVYEPIQYMLSSGGQRIRPMLTLLWCEACGGQTEQAIHMALAVELAHTMSLIQDDLPCMDNSDVRRGQHACHVKYGEHIAILASDILLADAIRMVSSKQAAVDILVDTVHQMANGQALELLGNDDWDNIHGGKTAALLSAACELGVVAADGSDKMIKAAKDYGYSLGMAYQYMDDLRDHDGSVLSLGNEYVEWLCMFHRDQCLSSAVNDRLYKLAKEILV